jgi:hypothetical protein
MTWRVVVLAIVVLGVAFAQGPPGGRGAAPPQSPKEGAPIDITGYWVSIVTEDWRFRMVLPPKGDYASVPLTPEGRKVADTWDPAKDEAAGNQCKSYGAAGLMRQPGRLHITWDNDTTLKIETDAGTQTRLMHFGGGAPQGADQGWQGYSAAQWEMAPGGRGGGGGGGQAPTPQARGGSLKAVTTKMRAGYLRKNGVPYSGNATLTEYYSRTMEPNGDSWLVVTSVVEDSQYLNQPFITSTHFKKQPDATGWNPTACSSR